MRNTFTVKFINCLRKIIYLKSKMAQTGCFRIGRTCRWVREGEQLDDIVVIKSAVSFP